VNGFAVDPDELRDGGGTLAKLGEELGEHNTAGWFMAPEEVGHDGLAAELRDFQKHLTAAIAMFRRDVEEASGRLRASADLYEDQDTQAFGGLR
jgi:hypothetical protein